jgi:hypothetical protein
VVLVPELHYLLRLLLLVLPLLCLLLHLLALN